MRASPRSPGLPFPRRAARRLALSALLLAVAVRLPAEPAHVLRVVPAQRIRAVNVFDITHPGFVAEEWFFFVPAAPELPGQPEATSTLVPGGTPWTELSPLRRPVLAGRLKVTTPEQRASLRYVVTYEARLVARELLRAKPGAARPAAAPLPPEARAAYLASSATFYDFDAPSFQEWLDRSGLRRREGEDDVAFARRAFLHVRGALSFESRSDADRRASAACRTGRSDCGGLANVYVSILRANGVPARTLSGKWATSMEPGLVVGDIPNARQHVKAEFHAEGVGWVPVDPSAPNVRDPSRGSLEHFGRDAGDFLALQVDYDLVLETPAWGRTTQPWLWFACWPRGAGSLDAPIRREDWQVEVLPP